MFLNDLIPFVVSGRVFFPANHSMGSTEDSSWLAVWSSRLHVFSLSAGLSAPKTRHTLLFFWDFPNLRCQFCRNRLQRRVNTLKSTVERKRQIRSFKEVLKLELRQRNSVINLLLLWQQKALLPFGPPSFLVWWREHVVLTSSNLHRTARVPLVGCGQFSFLFFW